VSRTITPNVEKTVLLSSSLMEEFEFENSTDCNSLQILKSTRGISCVRSCVAACRCVPVAIDHRSTVTPPLLQFNPSSMSSPPCKQMRLDRKASNGQVPSCTLLLSYSGSCQCGAVTYDIQTPTSIDSNATVYRCECSGCFKRGYKFFVVSIKQFRFTSQSASDLGTFASETGLQLS
jgi:hypothetical protein